MMPAFHAYESIAAIIFSSRLVNLDQIAVRITNSGPRRNAGSSAPSLVDGSGGKNGDADFRPQGHNEPVEREIVLLAPERLLQFIGERV